MSGKLASDLKNQLEQWIGTGPKNFQLLYSFTRDGCSNGTFHQKCDNQGPTVTVLYNQQGSIYGGYTAVNWDQSHSYGTDATAFLFRLQYNAGAVFNKFTIKKGKHDYAVYRHASYGPTFGGGNAYDLYTFTGTINKSGGCYNLNGSLSINSNYDTQGIPASQINNGTMNVTELEVYKVTDGKILAVSNITHVHIDEEKPSVIVDKPWRDTAAWNAEFLEGLKRDIEEFTPPTAAQVKQSRILLLGPVGSGKSSFFNTIASVFRGYVSVYQASSGSAEQSITSQYRMYQIRHSETGNPLKFRLCDTRGLEENQGLDANDIFYLLDGNIPDRYQFNPSSAISPDMTGFIKNTTLKDRIHCVCIIIDGSTVDVLPEKVLEKIKSIQSKIRQRGVPLAIVLTKVDKLCSKVDEDTSFVFKSKEIEEKVNTVSQLFGVPRNHVLLVKNYERETTLKDNINILALITLQHILTATKDYMFNFLEDEDFETTPLKSSKD